MIYSENILICIGMPLLIAMFYARKSARYFTAACLTGMFVCLLSGYISGYINLASGMTLEESAVYVAPIIEEIMKLLPLLFCMFVLGLGEQLLLNAAVAIGVGFAVFENCVYLLQAGAESLFLTLIRGLAVGVMHVVSMLLLDLGLTLMKQFRAISVPAVVGAACLSIIFHGLYNLLVSRPGVSAWVGYCLPLLIAVLYYRFFFGVIHLDTENPQKCDRL